jgi:uncharacterized protein YdhG (YjbR/CyaY superfamily)
MLQEVRITIKKTTPTSIEAISYWIPTFKLHWNLVHFAAFKSHIWFYPASSWVSEFREELINYKQWKWSIQFPFDKPIPFDLIKKIVAFRVSENLLKAKPKNK